ncbi:MAG: DNA-processing protein DprA [Actinomycetota bacterium]
MGGVIAVPDDVILARAYLSRVAEPASLPVWDWVRREGPVAAAASIRRGLVDAAVADATAARRSTADAHGDLEAAQRHGLRLVVPESADWPHFALAALESTARRRLAGWRRDTSGARPDHDRGEPVPPLGLWVSGSADPTLLGVRSVAIVGSRAATPYGEHVTSELGYGLARRGVSVVSGGAYGIDAVAHRSALAADGCTILVSAGGLDRPYPTGNASLYARAKECGLVISESPPGAAPHRHRFLTRNRLIAAFSTGTVVVEAAARSGALNTAAHARELGRSVMAVPGPVTSAMSAGCHQLLRAEPDPALLVTSVDDILLLVGSIGEGVEREAPPRGAAGTNEAAGLRARLDGLDPVARRVFDGLPAWRPAREDELAVRSGVCPREVIRAIPALRLAGVIDVSDDGFRIAAQLRCSGGSSG